MKKIEKKRIIYLNKQRKQNSLRESIIKNNVEYTLYILTFLKHN